MTETVDDFMCRSLLTPPHPTPYTHPSSEMERGAHTRRFDRRHPVVVAAGGASGTLMMALFVDCASQLRDFVPGIARAPAQHVPRQRVHAEIP